jgi:hypothetical protein
MILKKLIVKIICFVLLAVSLFSSGFILGHLETNRKWADATMAMREMSQYLYQKFDENFGNIDNKNEYNIIGGFNLYKDMDFAIILEKGVKTIKVYK